LTSVWIPESATKVESFIWLRPIHRFQVGVAHLWEQNSYRILANTILIPETKTTPALRIGAGIQESLIGNPGYFGFVEKHFPIGGGSLHVFSGIGFRSNENHGHPLVGFKYSSMKEFTLGLQSDGHLDNFFVSQTVGEFTITLYWIDFETLGMGLSWMKF